ncbi:hypothetical protein [Palleronia marisminoris]|nr:hypothetical protein [Palleronia marisminoris]
MDGGTAGTVVVGFASTEWELQPVTAADDERAIAGMREFCNSTSPSAMRKAHGGANIETSTNWRV